MNIEIRTGTNNDHDRKERSNTSLLVPVALVVISASLSQLLPDDPSEKTITPARPEYANSSRGNYIIVQNSENVHKIEFSNAASV
jgi:hypothetical protein